MKENFEMAIEFVLKWEGGYTNNPYDPGGETKFGISKRSYPNLDIKALTREQAVAIYKKDYWDKCGCDRLPYPLDIIVFDTAVNCGVQRALTWYQEYPTWCQYLLRRAEHYITLADRRPQFFKGWMNRWLDLWKLIKS